MKFDVIKNGKVILNIKSISGKIIRQEEVSIGKLTWATNMRYIKAKKLYEYEKENIECAVWRGDIDNWMYGQDDRYPNYSFDQFKTMMKKDYDVDIEAEEDDLFYAECGSLFINIEKMDDVETLVAQINEILYLNEEPKYEISLK